jgi:hypothetical protein
MLRQFRKRFSFSLPPAAVALVKKIPPGDRSRAVADAIIAQMSKKKPKKEG